MATQPISPAQVKDVLERAHASGYLLIRSGGRSAGDDRPTLNDLAVKMGMPRDTLHTYLTQHAKRLGWDAKRPETWVISGEEARQPLSVRERARYQRDIQRLRDDLRTMARQQLSGEDLREAVFGLSRQPIVPPVIATPRASRSSVPPVPLLFASDFQWGEKISAAQLDGVNEFSLRVARERYELLITKAIDICLHHAGTPRSKKVVYVRGGDMVSGDIHQELRETNEAMSVGQVVDLVEHEAAGIAALRTVFDEVLVISIPGNHGRTTIKPFAKGYAETNYDTLSAWMLEREFRGDKGVRFHTPASGDAIFEIYGWRFCATHGDRIGSRGGMGFIGPAATIARGMKKNYDYWSKLGVHLDYQLVGHFHTSLELELGFSNGSLPGLSEYARDFRATPARASQWLLFIHPEHGVSSRWPIYLSPPVKAGRATQAFEFLKA